MEEAGTRWLAQHLLNAGKRATEKRRRVDRHPLPTNRPRDPCRWTGWEKNQNYSLEAKRALIEPEHPELSIAQQCELLGLARSSYYYEPVPVSEENLLLMRLLDEQYTRTPFYGTRKMTA